MTRPHPERPQELMDVIRETAIDSHLRALKMPGAARHYRELARQARADDQDMLSYLESVLETELESRRQNQIAQRLRDAHFPYPRDLDGFDFTVAPQVSRKLIVELGTGRFVAERESVIFMGPSGTGKSHLSIALGRAAIMAGYRSRYTTAMALANELVAAQDGHSLARVLRSWARYDLVVIDEIGYLPFSVDSGRLMFQFFSELSERRSALITTNLEFSRWGEVFGDAGMTAALLDRLTYRAQIVSTDGESYRFRQAQAQARPGQSGG